YISEYRRLVSALHASRRKIFVFIGTVLMMVVLIGTVMYLVEGPENGFTSIPMSVYWAITTVTTVGFGDITPRTDLGRAIAGFSMLLGWGVLAVPTGIVTAEMAGQGLREQHERREPPRRSAGCGSTDHSGHARFCQACGRSLDAPA